jgi:hypothetical protein
MRRLIAIGALALLVLAAAVPLTSASTTSVTKYVDGSITTSETLTNHVWIARFEVRTTPAGVVQFGYLELYGIGGDVKGEIHQFTIDRVHYFTSALGQGAAFDVREWRIVPDAKYLGTGGDAYVVTDGAAVGKPDTFVASLGWTVDSGNISIYSTGGQNQQ